MTANDNIELSGCVKTSSNALQEIQNDHIEGVRVIRQYTSAN